MARNKKLDVFPGHNRSHQPWVVDARVNSPEAMNSGWVEAECMIYIDEA